jgi:hypothetical protein
VTAKVCSFAFAGKIQAVREKDGKTKNITRAVRSHRTALPRLLGSLFRRAMPTTRLIERGMSIASPLTQPSPNGTKVGIRTPASGTKADIR